ncbi:MAG TPA: hypothetical protein VNO55_12410 [Polyangia bacterium]|nr:hypothetical protein [Polyangia bacterium]
MLPSSADAWMLCSACKKSIAFHAVHWVCSVSTCNRNRTRLVFCSVSCWDSHVATLRHRDAWAVEAQAPGPEEHARSLASAADEAPASPPRPALPPPPRAPQPPPAAAHPPSVISHAGGPALSNQYDHDDVLIVVSKMKKYIRDRSGMNVSDAIASALGDHVRTVCDEAIRAAARDGRKTVLDRDVPRSRR